MAGMLLTVWAVVDNALALVLPSGRYRALWERPVWRRWAEAWWDRMVYV